MSIEYIEKATHPQPPLGQLWPAEALAELHNWSFIAETDPAAMRMIAYSNTKYATVPDHALAIQDKNVTFSMEP